MLSNTHHLLVYLFAGFVYIAVDTVKKRDTHCDSTDVKIFFLYHLDGFKNIF